MKLNPKELEEQLGKVIEAARQGAEEPRFAESARAGTRILKVASQFASHQWRIEVMSILICAGIIDKLHGLFIKKPRLSDIVDPRDSAVGKCIHDFIALLADFRQDAPHWTLLKWVHADFSDVSTRMFCRRVGLSAYCGLARKLQLRFKCLPYRMQWFISRAASPDMITAVINRLLHSRPCDLGAFAQTFLNLFFPDEEALRSDKTVAAMRFAEKHMGILNR